MSRYMSRASMPRSWPLPRKGSKYVLKPARGPHSIERALPLAVVLRDILKVAHTRAEVNKILHAGEVLVDGKVRVQDDFPVGLFDILGFPRLKKHYKMVFTKKGKLALNEVAESASTKKICVVIGKKMLRGKKQQVGCHDGRTFFYSGEIKIGDSLVVDLRSNKPVKKLTLDKGAFVYVIGGKHRGKRGLIDALKDKSAVVKADSEGIEIALSNVFVAEKE